MFRLIFVLISLLVVARGEYDRTIKAARIESCRGCSLNRLPEVQHFIFNDVPKYDHVEFKPIHGAPPELVLLSEVGEEIHRLPLSRLTHVECNELLETYGFTKTEEDNLQETHGKNVKVEF